MTGSIQVVVEWHKSSINNSVRFCLLLSCCPVFVFTVLFFSPKVYKGRPQNTESFVIFVVLVTGLPAQPQKIDETGQREGKTFFGFEKFQLFKVGNRCPIETRDKSLLCAISIVVEVMVGSTQKELELREQQRNLLVAKSLFFATAMSSVGWQRFQNNFYLDAGLSSHEIGTLKSIGLMLKIVGEPFWSMIADLTDEKAIFGLCMIMQVATMEMLRVTKPLTYNMILLVKVLRTTTAPSNTLTNTASFKLTEGSKEGYGQQRVFGSIAWGGGAFLAGYLIDMFGMDAVFFYTYFFNTITLFFIIFVLPSSSSSSSSSSSTRINISSATTGLHVEDTEGGLLLPDIERIHTKVGSNSSADNDILRGLKNRSRSRSCSNGGESHATRSSHNASKLKNAMVMANAYAKEVYMFLSHATCRALLVNAFLYGIVMTVPETFLYISLEEDFDASRTYSGIITTISVLGCIPLFWYSTYFIATYGHFNIIFMSECSCVLRLFAYALLSPKWRLSLYFLPGDLSP